MSLIAALAISALGLSVLATPESTNTSGDQSADIVDIAAAQVGYYEGADGYTKYGDWYGLPYSDWCAMFVSWCADQAGVSTDVFPRFALCSAGADWFISQGRFHYAGTYAPQAGDLIFYASYGNIYHVGLVTGSDSSHVYSIEGNYSEAVFNVSYPLSYGDIMGYASPAYNSSSSVLTSDDEDSDEQSDEEIFEEETDIDETDAGKPSQDEPIHDDSKTDDDTAAVIAESDTEAADIEKSEDSDEVEVTEDSDTESSDSSNEADDEIDTETDTESDVNVVIGDVSGDNFVDSHDALMIRRYLLGTLKDNETMNYLAADADASGDITINDALVVLKMSVGL